VSLNVGNRTPISVARDLRRTKASSHQVLNIEEKCSNAERKEADKNFSSSWMLRNGDK